MGYRSVAIVLMGVVLSGCSCGTDKIKTVTVMPARAVITFSQKGEKPAAEELARHLKLITGVDVPVQVKSEPGAFEFTFETCKLRDNDEACDWCVTPSNVVFRGNVAFAVTDFLENALGVRWIEGDFISCEQQNSLRITQLSGSWTPELNIRTIRGAGEGECYRVFCRRMRGGSHDAPKYGHAFTAYWKRFGKAHPEFFAMRKDGVRAPRGVKPSELQDDIAVYNRAGGVVGMCVTCEGFQDQVVADWVASGKPKYINLCENDVTGPESCQCPTCKALDVVPAKVDPKWETHYADRYVWFGNRILAKARMLRPDVKVSYYAYNATQDAPARERPDEASVIGIVPTVFTDAYIARYVDAWRRAGARHFFYRPNRHHYYRSPYLPTGSEENFFDIFCYLKERGCIGFDYDAPVAAPGGFDWLGAYVLFHAMQDSSKPYSYWEDHYCQAYGAAKDDVKAYYRYWREKVWNRRLEPNLDTIVKKGKCFNFGRGLVQNLKDYYRAEDFDAAEKFVVAAEAKATTGSQREAVKRLRIAHDHARLFFKAVAHKSKANTEALVAYRTAHGYPLYTWAEQYFGDVTGVQGLLGPEKK